MRTATCSVVELTLGRSLRALRIENDLLSATILVDKGADIYQLVYKPRGVDVLWKTPWGLKEQRRGVPTGFDSGTLWLENYPGGWQVLFPNGGDECAHKGVTLSFHGEASLAPWDYQIICQGHAAAEVRLQTRLVRSPFRLERTMRVERGKPLLTIHERITNEANEPMDYMWGHHPAFGAPFLSGACRIDIGARSLLVDDAYVGAANPLPLGQRLTWPVAEVGGGALDLSHVPGRDQVRDLLAYFTDFESGWYAVTNPELGFGFGLTWPAEIFPHAWFWQEMHASPGFPFYKRAYTMAIEPFTSIPGQGLLAVMQKTGTHRTLSAGQSVEATVRAVFYEVARPLGYEVACRAGGDATAGVERIEPDGSVIVW
jgi:hypothetical protein